VVLAQLDKLVEPLEKTLTAKLKSDAVKQEVRAGCHLLALLVLVTPKQTACFCWVDDR
jgi:hypothetical protein